MKRLPAKSARRDKIINDIMSALKTKKVYDTIDYKNRAEDYLKQYLHPYFLGTLGELHKEIYRGTSINEDLFKKKAQESLIWEGHKNQKIPNMMLFGTKCRPDFVVEIEGIKVAVEIKMATKSNDVRSGLGQSIFYTNGTYDFCVLLVVDCTKEGKIKDSLTNSAEDDLVESLWKNYNVKMDIV